MSGQIRVSYGVYDEPLPVVGWKVIAVKERLSSSSWWNVSYLAIARVNGEVADVETVLRPGDHLVFAVRWGTKGSDGPPPSPADELYRAFPEIPEIVRETCSEPVGLEEKLHLVAQRAILLVLGRLGPLPPDFLEEFEKFVERLRNVVRLWPTGVVAVASGPGMPAIHSSPTCPTWDKRHGLLTWGEEVIRRYSDPAETQAVVLDAFEQLGWPQAIDNPFLEPGAKTKAARKASGDLLRSTIGSINEYLGAFQGKQLKFSANGRGQVCWSIKFPD